MRAETQIYRDKTVQVTAMCETVREEFRQTKEDLQATKHSCNQTVEASTRIFAGQNEIAAEQSLFIEKTKGIVNKLRADNELQQNLTLALRAENVRLSRALTDIAEDMAHGQKRGRLTRIRDIITRSNTKSNGAV